MQPQAHLRGKRFPATVRSRETVAVGSVGVACSGVGCETLCCIARPSPRQGRVIRGGDSPERRLRSVVRATASVSGHYYAMTDIRTVGGQ